MKFWLSCRKFTCRVYTDERGTITWAAPIARRFVGQPLENLLNWMQQFGGVLAERG